VQHSIKFVCSHTHDHDEFSAGAQSNRAWRPGAIQMELERGNCKCTSVCLFFHHDLNRRLTNLQCHELANSGNLCCILKMRQITTLTPNTCLCLLPLLCRHICGGLQETMTSSTPFHTTPPKQGLQRFRYTCISKNLSIAINRLVFESAHRFLCTYHIPFFTVGLCTRAHARTESDTFDIKCTLTLATHALPHTHTNTHTHLLSSLFTFWGFTSVPTCFLFCCCCCCTYFSIENADVDSSPLPCRSLSVKESMLARVMRIEFCKTRATCLISFVTDRTSMSDFKSNVSFF